METQNETESLALIVGFAGGRAARRTASIRADGSGIWQDNGRDIPAGILSYPENAADVADILGKTRRAH